MKHLKTYKLFELHSSTYFSAAEKMKELGDDYSKRNRMKDMGDYRKSQEEMASELEKDSRRDKRTSFRIFSTKYPKILQHLKITNWRQLNFNNLEDLLYSTSDLELMDIILEYGLDPNTPSSNGFPAIYSTCINKISTSDLNKAKKLFENSININSEANGNVLIDRVLKTVYRTDHRSLYNEDLNTVLEYLNMMLAYSKSSGQEINFSGASKLIQNEKINKLLLPYLKSNINDLDEKGRNVLFTCKTDLIKEYVQAGVSTDVIDNDGRNLAFTGRWRLKVLEEVMGDKFTTIDLNLYDNKNDTPLSLYVRNNDDYAVSYLLDFGADPDKKFGTDKDISLIESVYAKKLTTHNSSVDGLFAALINKGVDYEVDPKKPFVFHCVQYGLRTSLLALENIGVDLKNITATYRGKTILEYAETKHMGFWFKEKDKK